MTEATPSRDVAQDAMSIAADSMGHDFVAALLAELRSMPAHWAQLPEDKQQRIIENLKEKIRTGVDKALQILTRAEFPAVQAELKAISWQQGITATLTIPRDALFRHQLCDAQGQKVLVVMAAPDRWFDRMDELKAKSNQSDLFDDEAVSHIPGVDQPAYRRDQDPTATTGSSWSELRKSMGLDKKAEDGVAPNGDDAPPAQDIPDQYRAEPAGPIERRNDAGEWAPVKLKEVKRDDIVRLPGLDVPLRATTPAMKADKNVYVVRLEPETPLTFGSAASAEEERTAGLRILQERLSSIGVGISLGALQALSAEEVQASATWCEAYAADPDGCKIARPLWLPIPDKGDAQ